MGEVPDSLPVTPETRDRLRSQANQLGEAEVLRLIDLLHVAVDDVRQGGDPRLPLELALVKVTRPGADLARESTGYRLEQLETRLRARHRARAAPLGPARGDDLGAAPDRGRARAPPST
jgi:DNA polymerase-3 subunit gamma/tau